MLERSVRSIVEQTYPNWELILCDDGSTNAALLWMQNLAARDSRIRLLQNDRNWVWLGREPLLICGEGGISCTAG